MIIAIDFDGTIVRHQYPYIGELIPGAKEYIRKLKEDGHTIVIWTCRANKPLDDARQFLDDNGIPYDGMNEECQEVKSLGWISPSPKIYADIYIDDRQVGGLPPWHMIYELVQQSYDKL